MATKKAFVKQVQGITFVGKTDSNHWITMDGPDTFGGSNAGIRPKELLMIALGGCSGSDITSILSKKKIKVDEFEMNISAEVAEEHPQVYTKMHIEFVFKGKNIPAKDVERAIELSITKYCSVTAMLQKAMPIEHSYRIVETE
ncbi:MAG TPA: OsmC family protein [Ignavibacteriaceae bacterium]|jgi:putative redox protein